MLLCFLCYSVGHLDGEKCQSSGGSYMTLTLLWEREFHSCFARGIGALYRGS